MRALELTREVFMRGVLLGSVTIGLVAAAGVALHLQAQAGQPSASPVPTFQVPADKLYPLEDALLQWPLLPANKAYGAIDGKKLHRYVEDQTAISRRYRDAGHPQFWGRIIGTSADEESQQWMLNKFKQAGLSDVRLQSFDMVPQWMPQSWTVTGTAMGKTILPAIFTASSSVAAIPSRVTGTP